MSGKVQNLSRWLLRMQNRHPSLVLGSLWVESFGNMLDPKAGIAFSFYKASGQFIQPGRLWVYV